MKALMILKDIKIDEAGLGLELNPLCVTDDVYQAIEELEDLQKEKDLLEEYVQFARLHIETYRCACGSLGRIGYRCSNKECNKY